MSRLWMFFKQIYDYFKEALTYSFIETLSQINSEYNAGTLTKKIKSKKKINKLREKDK